MEDISQGKSTHLPLSSLRLLVPPVRLVSAAAWQTVQQKVVSDYGVLEEFVSMVTDFIPELLSSHQRAQLILGLRARLILELCRCEATATFDIVKPHLDRIHTLIAAWVTEVGATDVEIQNSDFVDLVKNILKDPDQREHFFQKVFPKEFGPTFDEALHSLMWIFLSRLENFLPLQSFQQVASMLVEVSSVLEECMESVSHWDELRTLLRYQKEVSQLDPNDASLDGVCIILALKLPSVKRTEAQKTPTGGDLMNKTLSCTPDLEKGALTLPQTTHIHTKTGNSTGNIKTDQTNWTPSNGPAMLPGDTMRPSKNASHLLKQCHVQLERVEMPLSSQLQPVRRKKGQRMKKILLKEKRGLREEAHTASTKAASPDWAPPEVSDSEDSANFSKDTSYMAPVSDCSEDDSWSYYSEDDSDHMNTSNSNCSMADSWSYYSDDTSSLMSQISRSTEDNILSNSSNEDLPEDLPFIGPENISATSRTPGISSPPKKIRKVQCFICKENVNTVLKKHLRTHFPTGDYTCPGCDSRFKLFSSLKTHMLRRCYEYIQQQVSPETPDKAKNIYKCDECQAAFRYKVSLERHKVTHNELYCNVCRRVLRDAAMLARHKVSHTPYQCTRCEESFTYFLPLQRHFENVHKISRPFKCNHCPKTLPKLRALIVHEWTHTGHLPFQCAQCSVRFRSDSELIHHQRVHTREKPYLCPECGKTFSQRSNLLRHVKLVHSEFRNVRRHSCSQCEKSFKERGALIKHQRRKHLNEVFRHPCPYCGKMVAASTLTRHKLMHTGERPFKCTMPNCDKFFRSTSEVKRHVLCNHTSDRPYKCDVCGKGFVNKCFLNTHSKIHSGEKPFVCHICGKAFPKLYSMQRHKNLVHTFISH